LKRITAALVLSSVLLGPIPVSVAQDSTPTGPDNSAVNMRDRETSPTTAGQQSSVKSDVELTRRIRRAVVKDESLSMMARNVKIISADGSVTLRGPVKSEEEKATVARLAERIAGATNVNNQLEVKN
jgi:hyperosmotically inducible periplasmic protein